MFFAKLQEKIIHADGFGSYLDPLTKHRLINAPPINDLVKDLTPDSVAKDRQKRAKNFLDKLGEKINPEESKESFEVNLELVEPTKNLPTPSGVNQSYPQEALWWQKAIARAFSRGDIAAMADSFLKKYFHELGSFPVPRFEIVNNPNSRWNGRCIYKSSDRHNTTIKLQKLIVNDETTLKRVLLHELIHHVDFLTNFVDGDLRRARHDGHGEFFKQWAAKINAIEGDKFVTEKSDENYVESIDKDFFVLIAPMEKGFAYAWTLRPSFEQKQVIQVYVNKYKAKLVETKDIRWMRGSKISKRSGLSRPLAPEDQQKLKDLYESASSEAPKAIKYLMLIKPSGDSQGYMYTWMKKADPKVQKRIEEISREEGAKVFYTEDVKWANKRAESKRVLVFLTPLDKDSQEELKTIYEATH